MTQPAAATLAERSPDSLDADAWILTVPTDAPSRAVLDGGELRSRGGLRTFVVGYLFDRTELRQKLGLPRDAEDAELVLTMTEREGESALSRLRGAFAVALVDHARGRTIVARDQLGTHPVYFAEQSDRIQFSSSMSALLAQPGVSRDLNPLAMAEHLCSRWPMQQETFFQSIKRLPPGWRAVIDAHGVRFDRYWDPVPDTSKPIEWLSEAETKNFGQILDRAVSRCLQFGRAGIFLSGGFDSVSIAAVATDAARKEGLPAPYGLSLGFPDPTCNEQPVQRGVAEKLGIPLRLVDFTEAAGPRGLIEESLDLDHLLPQPLYNCWAPAYLELARRGHADGVRTILTGSGGDEWLGVSPFLAADLMLRGDFGGLIRFLRTWHRSHDHSLAHAAKGTFWTFGLRPIIGRALFRLAPEPWNRNRAARATRSDPEWFVPDPAARERLRRRAQDGLALAAPGGGFYARESRAGLDHALTSMGLEEQHVFGRMLGMRFMHPYWDADLTTQIYRTRPEWLLRGGRAKGLVRETVAQRFPALGFERQRKVSALTYFQALFCAEGPALYRRLGRLSALESLGILDAAGAHKFVEDAFQKQNAHVTRVLHLLNFEAWARHHLN